MTPNEWSGLRYFDQYESWGDSERMDRELLGYLDEFRHFLGMKVVVLCGTQGQHVANSQHPYGKAVDIIVPNWKKHILDLMLAATRFPFRGLGIYPDWVYNKKRVGGLHLDTRDLTISTPKVHKAFWMGIKQNGKTTYLPLDFKHLKQHKVI
jgi:hypothetical protein